MRATLSGQTVTRAMVQIPAWGLPWAEVETDSPEALEDNAVELQIVDLTMAGTAVTKGPYRGRSRYRIVAGSGGWGEVVEAKSYTSDEGGGGVGVLRSDVLRDVAGAAGEPIDLDDVEGVLGGHWTRQEGPAARTLELVSPRAWYAELDGVAHIGARPAVEYTGEATRMDGTDLAAGRIELAPDALSGLLPGAVVDGLEAADIEVRFGAKGLRATVWAKHGAPTRGLTASIGRMVRQLMADRRLAGSWEYRVLQQVGERLDLQPVRTAPGLPFLTRVRSRLAPGHRVEHRPGSLVLVTFIDGSPARPAVVGGDDPEAPGWLPKAVYLEADGDVSLDGTLVKAGAGWAPVVRQGDKIEGVVVQGSPGSVVITALTRADLAPPTRVLA